MDPDRRGIDDAFRSFVNRHGLNPNNRLLFYFAGHGHSMIMGYGGQMGYLVGRDAPNPNVDRVGFRDHALSMQVIETYARNIESKHALFVFDACFAGSVFDATRAIPEVIAEKTGRPVRQFITSGTADQQVPDTSIFRRQFVVALKGEGDLDKDGYVTGAELGQFLETSVTNYSRRSQTPQYGKLRDPLLDKGDFVFVVPQRDKIPAAVAALAPSGGDFDLEELEKRAKAEESVRAEWSAWQEGMVSAFAKVEGYVQRSVSPELKVAALDKFLRAFGQDNPFSVEDEMVRDKAARMRTVQVALLAPAGSTKSDTQTTQKIFPELDYSPDQASIASRVTLRAKYDSWVQVRDDVHRRLLVTRLLRAGDSYRVPDLPGLTLFTGNAGALEILVDGEAVDPIGPMGAVRRKVALDVDRLREGTATQE